MDWLTRNIIEVLAGDKRQFLLSQGYPEYVVDKAESWDRTGGKLTPWYAKSMRDTLSTNMSIPNNMQMFNGERKEEIEGKVAAMRLDNNTAIGIADWFNAIHPNIMSMQFTDVVGQTNAWHEQMKASEDTNIAKLYRSTPVYDYGNGWKIVELTPEDCDIEGELMGHCVGGYAQRVENKSTRIFSLRDPGNMPHVTIETSPDMSYVDQIQGKGNKEPIDEYAEMIKQWVNSLRESGKNIYVSDEDGFELESYAPGENRYGLQRDLTYLDFDDLIGKAEKEITLGHRWNWKVIDDVSWGLTSAIMDRAKQGMTIRKNGENVSLDFLSTIEQAQEELYGRIDDMVASAEENLDYYEPEQEEDEDDEAYQKRLERHREQEYGSVNSTLYDQNGGYRLWRLTLQHLEKEMDKIKNPPPR